jgi:hypothetical protein
LNDLDFVWVAGGPEGQQNEWQNMFDKLKEYSSIHGHANVSQKPTGELGKLGRWVKTQREWYHGDQPKFSVLLTKDQKIQLELIGFQWQRGGTASNEEHRHTFFEQLC